MQAIIRHVGAVTATLLWLSTGSAGHQPAQIGRSRLVLVPIAASPRLIEPVAESFREGLGLDVEVLPATEPSSDTYDNRRQQFIAERLLDQLRRQYASQLADKGTVVIGITSVDIYIRDYTRWRFAFGLRDRAPLAVVSYARMNPLNLGEQADENLLQSRLRKMVAKDVGLLMYHLPVTHDRRSLLFDNILGVDDLDFIEENFARAGMIPLGRR